MNYREMSKNELLDELNRQVTNLPVFAELYRKLGPKEAVTEMDIVDSDEFDAEKR